MNIYQSNTYRKDLSWLHFNNEPRFQGRQQGKDQQLCISIFVAYLIIPNSNQEYRPRHYTNILYIVIWQICRDGGFFQYGNQLAMSWPSPQCLVDQIQVEKPILVVKTIQKKKILVVTTDRMPDHPQNREQYNQHRYNIIREVINVQQPQCRTKNWTLLNSSTNWIFF